MLKTMVRGKIHRATVTETDVDYEGSVTVDRDLLDAADILPNEQVHLLDTDNGARLITYAIEGARGSGTVRVNGAAARLVDAGDRVIIVSYAQASEEELPGWQVRRVFVDTHNRIQPEPVPAT